MRIQVTDRAEEWFKDEFSLNSEHEFIRFFARYGGNSNIQSGFSLGISLETPNNIGAKKEMNGITFFIEEDDLWYFKGYDLEVAYQTDDEEIEFNYVDSDDV